MSKSLFHPLKTIAVGLPASSLKANRIENVPASTRSKADRLLKGIGVTMTDTLLFGAGGECDLGLSTGIDFVFDTYYTKKAELYNALKDFYKERLSDSYYPGSYSKEYLFNANSKCLKDLIDKLLSERRADLESATGLDLEGARSHGDLTKGQMSELAKLIISENKSSKTERFWKGLRFSEASHHGILEPLFSTLLNPANRSIYFWRLVNYYWSAYFSILLPVTNKLHSGCVEYEKNKYRYVLERLNEIPREVMSTTPNRIANGEFTYCEALKGRFDHVLTTNYTPFARALSRSGEATHLAGTLATFEDPRTLSVVNAEGGERIDEGRFVFPYLMTQAPVKPIVERRQMEAYAKAISILDKTDTLYVLGYSFNVNDAHIVSLVRDWVVNALEGGGDDRHLVYLKHCREETSLEARQQGLSELKKALRLENVDTKETVEVRLVEDAESETIKSIADGA